MIKKSLNIAFILLWTIFTTGFSISKHYCCDDLVSIKINNEAKSCCDTENGCCHNENDRYEIEDDFISVHELEEIDLPEYENLFPFVFSYVSNIPLQLNNEKQIFFESHPPPNLKVILSELQTFRC